MAKTKFDLLTPTGPLYAGVGVTDLVVEAVRDYVADAQKRVADVQKTMSGVDYQPQALRERATKVVSARVENLGKDAQARRKAVEARRKAVEERMNELQSGAKALPAKLQKLLDENVSTAGDTYEDLVKRGESLVGRIRRQSSTKATTASASTTKAKAKTTRTQATKSAKSTAASTKATAKRAAKKTTAKKTPAQSSAKATATSAEATVANAAQAVTDAAPKVGD